MNYYYIEFMSKPVYIFIGAPGSGKGTQAELLIKEHDMATFSPGAMFRQEMTEGTELGQQIKPIMDRGELVSDDITGKMILDKLEQADKVVILDGFPRTVNQANILDRFFSEKQGEYQPIIVEVFLSDGEIMERIGGRLTCVCGEVYHKKFNPPKEEGKCDKCGGELQLRSDSKPEIIANRIKVYHEQTEPVLSFYRDNPTYKMHKVDGEQAISDVYQEINKILKEYNG